MAETGKGAGGRAFPATVLSLLAAGGLTLAHLEVVSRGPAYAGPLLPLDHLFSLGAAAALLVVASGLGARLLPLLGARPDRRLEAGLFSAAVGAGGLGVLFLLLGAVGLLSGPALALTLLAVALATRGELRRAWRGLGAAAGELRERAGDPWLLAAAGVAAAGAAGFLFLHGAVPPGDWDSLMYHLEIPRRWLAQGRIGLPADNLHAAFIGPIQLLYLPLIAAGSPEGAALLNGLFALLLAVATFAVGERLLDGEAASFAALVLWASTGLLLVAATARVDTTLALFLLLGHGAVALAVTEPERRRAHLLRAGLVLGVAGGIKYHALAYTAVLAPVGLWALWRGDDGGRDGDRGGRLRDLLPAAGGYAGALLPWLGLTFALFGAPLYPFFAERVLQPWLADLYTSAGMPPVVDPGALGFLGRAREPFDLVSYFAAPGRITVEPEGVHYNANLLLLLLPLWLFHLRRRAVTLLAAPALLYAVGVIVPFDTTNLRYLFPAVVPLTLAAAFMGLELVRKLPRRGVRRVLLLVVGAVLLVPTLRSGAAWTRKAPVVEHAAGRISAQDYLAAGFPFYAGFVSAVNRNVPRGGEVLMLWEARGFHLAPPHLQDNVLSNWPLLVPYLERTGSCLEDTDLTHVLASSGAVRFYASRGASPERMRWPRFQPFRDRCLESVEEGGGWTLYRVVGG